MRKKLDTRFPAARIKKIMQADEDVGKIAMAVPVLVSKALELFLQDLCDRTYDITVQRGAKTVSSLHLKHCVQSYNEFDFLKEVVSKVPDYGHSDSAQEISKRRKVGVNESNDSDEELKKNNLQETSHAGSSSRGKGRGRGRGRGRPSKASLAEREAHRDDVEPNPNSVQPNTTQTHSPGKQIMDNTNSELKESPTENIKPEDSVISSDMRSFDLNAGVLDEGPEKVALSFAAPPPTTSAPLGAPTSDVKGEEYAELSEMDRMAVDHVQFAQLSSRLDEDEEDYDEEEEG